MGERKKHLSDIFVYDERVDIAPGPGFCRGSFEGDEGAVAVKLMDEDGKTMCFEWFSTDGDGYMTRGEFSRAMAFALGLSEARRAYDRRGRMQEVG